MEGDGALNNATKKLFADTMSVTQELIMREAYSVFVLNYVYLIKKNYWGSPSLYSEEAQTTR